MADVTKALVAKTASNVAADEYTAPASTTTTARCISAANTTAAPVTVTVKFNAVVVVPTVAIPANQVVVWNGAWVLAAAQAINLVAGAAASIDVYISGVETT